MTGTIASEPAGKSSTDAVNPRFDWKRIAYLLLASRGLDDTEENKLLPGKKVVYQFSARGHDLAQLILGSLLDGKHDGVGAYYRSRPLLLRLGLTLEDAFAGPLRKSGGFSDGRDIGVVCNFPNDNGPVVLPMSGDVGSQYTPTAGWAQAILYHRDVLKDSEYTGAIACVLGGEASVATNGFWSALTMATTLELPMGSDLAAVKSQYRKLMGRYHPDRHHRDPDKLEISNRLAAEITRAYDTVVAHLESRGAARK